MERKDILIVKGINQYGVLSHMLDKLGIELECRGYQVQICTWYEIEQWKQHKWDICISSQVIGQMFEVKADKYVTWLVDHPVHLNERLIERKNMKNLWIGCVDQTHVEYLSYGMDFQHVFHLPHFGDSSNRIKEYKERKIEVFFPASYLDIKNFEEEHSNWRNGAVKVVSDRVIAFLQNKNEMSVEQAIKIVLEQMGETVEKEFLVECMNGFGSYIDTYICRYYRQQVVKELLDEGVQLTVAGAGWKNFQKNYRGSGIISILSENMSYEDVLECMADSKMVLNVLPWFKDGSHERIASTLQNAAVCLTDQNQYTKRMLIDEVSAILYDRNNPKELVQKIRYYLEHQDEAEDIAQKGRDIAVENMTAENFVDMLLQGIEEEHR